MAKILIVDDESSIRKLLNRYLTDAGFSCSTAQDAEQAKNLLQADNFDLLLSDLNMPGESGIELARFVKQEYPNLAIVIVSGIDDPLVAKETLELEVHGYIVKPFTRNIVLIGVDSALIRHRLEMQCKAYQQEFETRLQLQTRKIESQVVFLQRLLDAVPSALFYLSPDGVLLGCNSVFEKFVGVARGAIVGKSLAEISPGNLAPALDQNSDNKLLSIGLDSFEINAVNAEWEIRHLLVKKAILTDDNGCVERIVCVMLDITEQNNLVLAFQASEQKYRQIVDNINIGVALLSPRMEIMQMNPQMHKWFPHAMPNKGLLCHQSFMDPQQDTPCDDCPVVKTFAEGNSFESTFRIKGQNQVRYFRDHSSPIQNSNGEVVAAILLVEEVTEKLVLERELHQSQKLEAIGQLAAGIAHEINTPIQYIGDNTGFLQDSFKDLSTALSAYDDLLQAVKTQPANEALLESVEKRVEAADLPYLQEEIPRAIEQSLDGVTRVSEIVRAMRDFSHPGSDQKALVDLNHAIHNTLTVSRNEWKYVAEMELDLDDSLPDVRCLPGEINQVLLNIIVNAAHAIADVTNGEAEGLGKISISTSTDNDFVIIQISDSGGGVPKDIQHRIFDPFFTTKGVGSGTGQGLAIAHSVISDKHGGNLRFESKENEGTTFIIELPLRSDEQEELNEGV